MHFVHVYELGPQILLRRSGQPLHTLVRCQVVLTRCIARLKDDGSATVSICTIDEGLDTFRFERWFPDWTPRDNVDGPDFQSGRPIEIAVPLKAYHQMVMGGVSFSATPSAFPHRELQQKEGFNPLVAAVRIDGTWELPL